MPYFAEPPWRAIRGLLVEAESVTSPEELCRQTMHGFFKLIPYDAANMAIAGSDCAQIAMMEGVGIERQRLDAYMQYYHHLDFFKDKLIANGRILHHDYYPHRHTKFVADFIAPQKIRFGLGLLMLDAHKPVAASVGLMRTKRGFTHREQAMVEIVQVNLNTMLTLLYKLNPLDSALFSPAELASGRLLSKREAEVAALLCHRLTANEVAVKLQISPLTARKHIENIYEKLGVRSRRELVGRLMGRGTAWLQ